MYFNSGTLLLVERQGNAGDALDLSLALQARDVLIGCWNSNLEGSQQYSLCEEHATEPDYDVVRVLVRTYTYTYSYPIRERNDVSIGQWRA